MEVQKTKHRNLTIDYMKAIGIILMVIGHMSIGPFFRQFIFSFHVPLFFLVAGYFSKPVSSLDILNQIRKDFYRLIVPCVTTQVLLVIWGGIVAYAKHDISFFLNRLYELLWLSSDTAPEFLGSACLGPIWFLMALFWAKLLWGVLARYRMRGVIIAIGISAAVYCMRYWGYLPMLPFCIAQGMISLVFLALGWLYRNYECPIYIKIVFIITWGFALIYGHVDVAACSLFPYPLAIVGACGAAIFLEVICCMCEGCKVTPPCNLRIGRFIQWIGANTMAILCMHHFEWYSSISYSIMCRIPFDLSNVGIICFRLIVAIILAFIVTRVPMLRTIYGINIKIR